MIFNCELKLFMSQNDGDLIRQAERYVSEKEESRFDWIFGREPEIP
jgi:hypothetical protein